MYHDSLVERSIRLVRTISSVTSKNPNSVPPDTPKNVMPSLCYTKLYIFQSVATIPSLVVFVQDCGVQETTYSNSSLGIDMIGRCMESEIAT